MYLIVGASGFLGRYFVAALNKAQLPYIATYGSGEHEKGWMKLDITDANAFSTIDVSEMNVIWLAAVSKPDTVYSDTSKAYQINVSAVKEFFNKYKPRNFCFASSDVVYGEGGLKNKFTETSRISPINEYGLQKAEAEQVVLQNNGLVVRYPYLFGKSLNTKKHFYDEISDSLQNNKQIELIADSYRSSIDFSQAADLTLKLILEGEKGIYNICGDGPVSKYDIGLKIAEENGASKDILVRKNMAESNVYSSSRAQDILMDNSKLKDRLNLNHILPF
jgi:dTDP-4-dehydrorhamnose reductase